MPEETTHDLHDFMQQLSDEMAAEYDRIQKRAAEDPGTAGDQGEENWAENCCAAGSPAPMKLLQRDASLARMAARVHRLIFWF